MQINTELDKMITKAEERYTEAKQNAIRDLQNIDINQAVSFGAGYYTKIDAVTRYATELQTLYNVRNMVEYYENEQ